MFRPPFFSSKGPIASFEGPLQFFHCPVRSPEGLRCPRGSYVHAPFCRFHLRSVLALDVAPSTIKGAGHGLFTLTARSKGDHVVDYFGESLSPAEVESRYPRKDVGVYCLQISQSIFIDAALFRGVGASANASRHGVKPNARFVVNPRTGSARLEVSRHIQAGGEIFVSYGSEYWRGAHATSHSTSHVPGWEWDCFDPFAQASVAQPVLVPAPDRVFAGRPGSVPALVPADSVHDVARTVSAMAPPPVPGLSFSLPLLSCFRVADFLGSLLNAISINKSIPPVDVVHVLASPVVSFPLLAGRHRQPAAFWLTKLADSAIAPVRCSRAVSSPIRRPLGVLSPVSLSPNPSVVFTTPNLSIRTSSFSGSEIVGVVVPSTPKSMTVPRAPGASLAASPRAPGVAPVSVVAVPRAPVRGVVVSGVPHVDVVPSARPRSVLAMSKSLQSFSVPTSPISSSLTFFSSPIPGVVSPSLSSVDSVSPRFGDAVPAVPVRVAVRPPSPHSTCGAECLVCWPFAPVRIAKPEVPPSSPSLCEVNVGPQPARCVSCVPGLFVCPAHLVACGAVGAMCCNYCLQVLCMVHMYCPCADAVARRAWVSSLPPPPMSSLSVRAVSPAVPASLSGALPVLPGPGVPPSVVALAFVGSPVPAARVALVSPESPSEDSDPDWPISDALRDFAFQTVVFRARSPDLSNNLNNSLFDCP